MWQMLTPKKDDNDCISAFQMKDLRKIKQVPWQEMKTDEWLLEKACVKQDFLNTIRKQKLSCFRHVTWKPSARLEKVIKGTTARQCRKDSHKRHG